MAKYIKVLASKSRTANEDSYILYNAELHKSAHIVVDVTNGSNLLVAIKGVDRVSSKTYTILTSSILASGTTVLRVGPELTAGANIAKDYIPESWKISATVSGATTFSVGASLI